MNGDITSHWDHRRAAVFIRWKGLNEPTEQRVETPFGSPSDAVIGGTMHGRQVYFLPRHGRGHRILPHELNHRANIYALRSLNVRWIICVTAVGSLQEKYAPRDVFAAVAILRPDQPAGRAHFFRRGDRGAHRLCGADLSADLRSILAESARRGRRDRP